MPKKIITYWIKTVVGMIFLFFVGNLKLIGAEQESYDVVKYIDSLQLEIAAHYKTVASISPDDNNCFDNIGWTVTMSGLTNVSGYLEQLKILNNAYFTVDSINRYFITQELTEIKDNLILVNIFQIIENMLPKSQSSRFLYEDIMDKVIMPALTYIAIERYKSGTQQKDILCQGMYKIIKRIELESERLKLSLNNTDDKDLTNEGKQIMDMLKIILSYLHSSVSEECSENNR